MATVAPKNIRVSDRANEIMDNLEMEGYFADGAAAYRTAIFIAISHQLVVENTPSTPNNKWDTSSIFRNSESDIECILTMLFPQEDPIPYGCKLAEAGLAWLDEKRIAGANIWEIINPKQ
jgi:hypothetical protein